MHTFDELNADPHEHPLLLTESIMAPKASRERMAQTAFESLKVQKFYVASQSVLSLYASGRTTGISLTCGYEVISCCPIYEGYPEPHAVLKSGFGGKQLTEYMSSLLSNKYTLDVCEDIKAKLCIVSINDTIDTHKDTKEVSKYTLPDGKEIEIEDEVLLRCGEALFQPKLLKVDGDGIDRMVYNSTMKVSVSIRRDLFRNVIMSGGTSMIKGFQERLEKGVTALSPSTIESKIIAAEERQYFAWIGGSILGSLSTFEAMWIEKSEYDEYGPAIVHRKCS